MRARWGRHSSEPSPHTKGTNWKTYRGRSPAVHISVKHGGNEQRTVEERGRFIRRNVQRAVTLPGKPVCHLLSHDAPARPPDVRQACVHGGLQAPQLQTCSGGNHTGCTVNVRVRACVQMRSQAKGCHPLKQVPRDKSWPCCGGGRPPGCGHSDTQGHAAGGVPRGRRPLPLPRSSRPRTENRRWVLRRPTNGHVPQPLHDHIRKQEALPSS